MKKVIIIATTIGIAIIGILYFSILPKPNIENLIQVNGEVVSIYVAGTKDVVFKLEGDETSYYINRGLEKGLDLSQLRVKYLNENINLTYIEYHSLLDFSNSSRHLAEVKYNGELLYSELN